MLDTLILLNLFAFVILFVLLYVVILLYFKAQSSRRDYQKLLEFDEKLKAEILQKIEEVAKDKVSKIFGHVAAGVDSDIKRHLDLLAKTGSTKSRELSEFITTQQEQQLKESQFYVANMLAKIEHEAEGYRKNKLVKIDEEIRQIVLSAAREVIGRAISLSEHEDLVTKALEKAKREQFFA